MTRPNALAHIQDMQAYVPGLSIDEIKKKFGLDRVIKLASNENPLGASPIVQDTIKKNSSLIFRYPQGGNPNLVAALADLYRVAPEQIAAGNGSDEIIDVLFRIMVDPRQHNVVCFEPCFGMYTVTAATYNIKTHRCPLKDDFSFDFPSLLEVVDSNTRLVFITTPDNPSGYCPPVETVKKLSDDLASKTPSALLVIDEAYIDFCEDIKSHSLLSNNILPSNVVFLRTFSKSFGLAGIRLGCAIMSADIANCFWRVRLPFSINILAEKAAIAAIKDHYFREETLKTVKEGRAFLKQALQERGCSVWSSEANFLMFQTPQNTITAAQCFNSLLKQGIIIRQLTSYNLPEHLRVTIGNAEENKLFINALDRVLFKEHTYV